MAKLYTVKEMAELLNQEFGENDANYEFTEERVRARLRSARARGIITPKHMGYDRRTNYYGEEDFTKLKATWVGPELAEFTEYPEDLKIINPEKEEVIIRSAKSGDMEAILRLLPHIDDERYASISAYLAKMLKSSQYANFVSTLNDEEVTGWAQAEISGGLSILRNEVTGVIRIYCPHERAERRIIVRSLYHRASRWLSEFNARKVVVELPAFMGDLQELFDKQLFLKPDNKVLFLANEED